MSCNTSDETVRLARLIIRRAEIVDFKKKIQSSVSHLVEIIYLNPKQSWLGWQQNSTFNWLMSGSWHHVNGLKTIYENSEEYAESL